MKSIVGDLIGKRNIVYAPVNRSGVLALFARLLDEFDMLLEETSEDAGFVIVRRRVDSGWERVKINLCLKSSEYSNGSVGDSELLICWHDDWPACPLQVFELKALFENDFRPTKPTVTIAGNIKPKGSEGVFLSQILPNDSGELLASRNITQQRFEKAIGDLDNKIKNFFPK